VRPARPNKKRPPWAEREYEAQAHQARRQDGNVTPWGIEVPSFGFPVCSSGPSPPESIVF